MLADDPGGGLLSRHLGTLGALGCGCCRSPAFVATHRAWRPALPYSGPSTSYRPPSGCRFCVTEPSSAVRRGAGL